MPGRGYDGRSPQGFFEEAPLLTTVAGFDGYFQEIGGPWTRVTGWTHDELTSRPFFEFVHPDDLTATEAELAHLGEGDDTVAFVNRYRRADGGWVALQWHARVVDDTHIYAIALDVSAVLERDRALARQQQLLRIVADLQRDELTGRDSGPSIADALAGALPLIGAHSGTVATLAHDPDGTRSTTCLASAGPDATCQPGTRTVLLEQVHLDVGDPEVRATVLEVASAVAATTRPFAARSLDADADDRPRHLLGLPIGAEAPVGVLGLIGDGPFIESAAEFLRPLTGAIATIIERDRSLAAGHAMSTQVLRLTTVLATMLDRSEFVLIATDAQERVTFLSAAAIRLLGAASPAEGRRASNRLRTLSPTSTPALADAFPVSGTGVHEVEWALLDAHGTPVPMAVSGSPIMDAGGELEGWVLLCTPLADRQRAEKARLEHASLTAQVEVLRARERQLAALTDATQYVVASRTRREALDVIDHFLPEAFGAHRAHLLRAVSGDRESRGPAPVGSVHATDCWAARTGRAFRSESGHGVRCAHLPPAGRHLCTPIGDGQHLAGIITVDLTLADPSEAAGVLGIESMVDDVARQCSAALANLRLRRALEDQALVDPLTRLGNRRASDRALGDALARQRSHDEPCAVLMVDIDHFKSINDRHGHDVGDEVLVAFARLLSGLVREEDHVARLGGEEFLVVLRDVARPDLDCIVESIRRGIERAAFPRGVRTTVSIGAVHVADAAVTADQAITDADALLYVAKHAGRNRAEIGSAVPVPVGSGRITGTGVPS